MLQSSCVRIARRFSLVNVLVVAFRFAVNPVCDAFGITVSCSTRRTHKALCSSASFWFEWVGYLQLALYCSSRFLHYLDSESALHDFLLVHLFQFPLRRRWDEQDRVEPCLFVPCSFLLLFLFVSFLSPPFFRSVDWADTESFLLLDGLRLQSVCLCIFRLFSSFHQSSNQECKHVKCRKF